MKKQSIFLCSLILCSFSLFFSCKRINPLSSLSDRDQVHQNVLNQVRLGDGVQLDLVVSTRWKIEKPDLFFDQFPTVDTFNTQVLRPRALELVKTAANHFDSVDSVFSSQREEFIAEIKNVLLDDLGEESILIKEIIVADLIFPKSYTTAMEQVGLQRQELEAIRQQSVVDLERSKASKQKAEADAQVMIATAKAESEVQNIKAKTETNRRKNELAIAETAVQIDRKKAAAEAERKKLLAKADLEHQTDLKNLEVQKQRELEALQVEKKRQMDKVLLEQQMDLAKICMDNPVFASFLINRELASKVDIAVLPTGTNSNVLGSFLDQKMKKD